MYPQKNLVLYRIYVNKTSHFIVCYSSDSLAYLPVIIYGPANCQLCI